MSDLKHAIAVFIDARNALKKAEAVYDDAKLVLRAKADLYEAAWCRLKEFAPETEGVRVLRVDGPSFAYGLVLRTEVHPRDGKLVYIDVAPLEEAK